MASSVKRQASAWGFVVAVLVIAGLVTAIAVAEHKTHSTRVVVQGSATTVASASNDVPSLPLTDVAVPAGFSRPTHVTGDPNKAGMWFLGLSDSELRLFNLTSPSATPTSFLLGSPRTDDLFTVAQNAVFVDSTGLVWVGVNNHLFRVDPATGSVEKTDLPKVTTFGTMQLPNKPSNLTAITSIARTGSTVAVGASFSTGITLVNATSMAITSTLASPPGTVTSLAYTTNGTLVATDEGVPTGGSFSFSGLKILGAESGATTASTMRTYPYGALFVHGAGSTTQLWEATSNNVSALSVTDQSSTPLLSVSQPSTLASVSSPYASGLDAAFSSNLITVPTHKGAAVLTTSGQPVGEITLPSFTCPHDIAMPPGVTSPPTSSQSICDQAALATGIDAAGNVWIIPSGSDEFMMAPTGSTAR